MTVAAVDPQLVYMVKRLILKKPAQLFEPLNILWPTGPGTSPALRKNLVILAAIDTITFGTAIGALAVLILKRRPSMPNYAKHKQKGLS